MTFQPCGSMWTLLENSVKNSTASPNSQWHMACFALQVWGLPHSLRNAKTLQSLHEPCRSVHRRGPRFKQSRGAFESLHIQTLDANIGCGQMADLNMKHYKSCKTVSGLVYGISASLTFPQTPSGGEHDFSASLSLDVS